MKIKKGFVLRKICDEMVVVGEGLEQVNFNKIICLNETAAMLWEKCQNRDFDADAMVDMLVENYEVDKSVAEKDVRELIESWTHAGLID